MELLRQASKNYENGRFQQAISKANSAVEKLPDSDQAHWLIGMSYYKDKKMREGLYALMKAEKVCKNPARLCGIYIGISLCNMGQGRNIKALEYIDKAAQANNGKSTPGIAWVKAGCLIGLGESREALKEMEKCIAMDPMLPEKKGFFFATYGLALNENKAYKEAARAAEIAINYDPDVSQAFIVAMEANLYMGNMETARKYARLFLEKKFPTRVHDEYCYQTLAYAIVGDYRQGIESLSKAIELLQKNNADRYLEYLLDRSILFALDKDKKNAKKGLRQFIDLARNTSGYDEEIKSAKDLLEKIDNNENLTFAELYLISHW
jgi:tetratricopeptide (TPR) repeat protein